MTSQLAISNNEFNKVRNIVAGRKSDDSGGGGDSGVWGNWTGRGACARCLHSEGRQRRRLRKKN